LTFLVGYYLLFPSRSEPTSPVSQAISSRLELTSTEYFFYFYLFPHNKKIYKKKKKIMKLDLHRSNKYIEKKKKMKTANL